MMLRTLLRYVPARTFVTRSVVQTNKQAQSEHVAKLMSDPKFSAVFTRNKLDVEKAMSDVHAGRATVTKVSDESFKAAAKKEAECRLNSIY